MAQTQGINRETVSGEALFILKNLKENGRLGRSNKLADVKALLEPSVSLEFDSYFFFLRKFHYIAMDREAQLKLTDNGEKIVDSGVTPEFNEDVYEFFADQLVDDDATQGGDIPVNDNDNDADEPNGFNFPPPPPPMTDEDEQMVPSVPTVPTVPTVPSVAPAPQVTKSAPAPAFSIPMPPAGNVAKPSPSFSPPPAAPAP